MISTIVSVLFIILGLLCLPFLYVIYLLKFPKYSYRKIINGETFRDQNRYIRSKAEAICRRSFIILLLYILSAIVFVGFIPVQSETIVPSNVAIYCSLDHKFTVVLADDSHFMFEKLDPEDYKYYFLDKYKNLDIKLKTYKSTAGMKVSGPHLIIDFPIEEELF